MIARTESKHIWAMECFGCCEVAIVLKAVIRFAKTGLDIVEADTFAKAKSLEDSWRARERSLKKKSSPLSK